jgi:hypothetical protein
LIGRFLPSNYCQPLQASPQGQWLSHDGGLRAKKAQHAIPSRSATAPPTRGRILSKT